MNFISFFNNINICNKYDHKNLINKIITSPIINTALHIKDIYCQRVRPSEDRRPGEAADYRASRRFLGGRNLRSASNLSVM